jgi:hypothetical protein
MFAFRQEFAPPSRVTDPSVARIVRDLRRHS